MTNQIDKVGDVAGNGEIAIVTGAASGMGKTSAARLLRAGWNVIGVDKDEERLIEVQDELGDSFTCCMADVIDRNALNTRLGELLNSESVVTAVINAAGIYPPTTLEDVGTDAYRLIFDTNVLGTLNVIDIAMSYIRRHSVGAAIVNFASIDALVVSPGQLIYSASKAAIVSITRSLAIELAPDRVIVNAVAPGWVDTPGNRATGRMQAALASVPLQRAASPEEIAEWVHWLCDRNSYLTGETIPISGGLFMH
jgi:3-oxoacyl-[acyl-carrier protein] reductase